MIAETDALPRQFRKSDVFESVAADVIWRLFFNGMNIQINPVKGNTDIEKKLREIEEEWMFQPAEITWNRSGWKIQVEEIF